jgi:hypothetical protein
MKTLKKEIKALAQNLRALRLELKESNRTTGYANYSLLTERKEEFRYKHLTYCWLKETKELSKDQFLQKHEKGSKNNIDWDELYNCASSCGHAIDKRKNHFKNKIKEAREDLIKTKLELKESNRTTGYANYYILKAKKDNYRSMSLAYIIWKKIKNDKFYFDRQPTIGYFIDKYGLEKPNSKALNFYLITTYIHELQAGEMK